VSKNTLNSFQERAYFLTLLNTAKSFMRKLITIIFLILLACPKEVIDYCRRLNVGIKISIIYLSLLLSTSVFGQLKKNTLSIAAGKANIESFTLYYAVGQSAMIGQASQGNMRFIHGYLNPIKNYANNTKIPVEWVVYPNPFREEFTIQFPFNIDMAQVQLFDLKGMRVFGEMVKNSPSSVKISQLGHLTSSSYILVIEHQEVLYQRQIIHDK
jgi:hypothetical protein